MGDANGIVNVSAKDKASNKQQNIRIQGSGGLSDSDIERMVQEAESMAAADGEKKAAVEARNEADTTIYNTEKTLMEHKAKVPQEDQDIINADIASLKEAIEKLKQPDEDWRGHVQEHRRRRRWRQQQQQRGAEGRVHGRE